ncbi:calcium-binding protein E63-1-like [Pollicipes pollicipes]|uniref:calcium-binding protein E63-1-like n=1 Tax=Pollicipes pollicipes TaxID=41117 RepID=UPI00188518C3|nr:calcium-binding protein E63-1-like [Pollicipes pollicipes]
MSGRMASRKATSEKSSLSRPVSASSKQQKMDSGGMVSDNELKELKMVFRLTDKNGDGSITADELKRMLQDKLDIDVDDALIGDLMTSAGENAGGLISEAQFITWFLKMQTLSADKTPDMTNDLFAAFRLFDKDGNGYITMDELRRAMELIEERMTESELSSLIEMADADKDGRINYEGLRKLDDFKLTSAS